MGNKEFNFKVEQFFRSKDKKLGYSILLPVRRARSAMIQATLQSQIGSNI